MERMLLSILSDISNVPTEVLVKQHLSRAKTLQKITRRAKQMWGEEWDIELSRLYQIDPKTMLSHQCYTLRENEILFPDCLNAFTLLATHLGILDLTCYNDEVSMSHVVMTVPDQLTLSVPNIVNALNNPTSKLILNTFRYLNMDTGVRFLNRLTFHKCTPTDGIPYKRFVQLGGEVSDACGYKRNCALSVSGVTTDNETYQCACTLFLDLPFNPSGKGWASPSQQHELCIENGIQFKGNAQNSWSAHLGRGANELETRYASSIHRYVRQGSAIHDLPAGLPLGILVGRCGPVGLTTPTPTHYLSKRTHGFFAEDNPSNLMAHIRLSTSNVRSNIIVYNPTPEIFLYCVGKRRIRAGSGLYHNGRGIRQKHGDYKRFPL